jgi:hypothetical protein
MFRVVAPNDNKLTLAVKVENIDHFQAPLALFPVGRAYSSPEQETENVKDEERGDEERHDCSEYWEQLGESFLHVPQVSLRTRRNSAKLTAFLASGVKRLING